MTRKGGGGGTIRGGNTHMGIEVVVYPAELKFEYLLFSMDTKMLPPYLEQFSKSLEENFAKNCSPNSFRLAIFAGKPPSLFPLEPIF